MPGLTPEQIAVLVRVAERGDVAVEMIDRYRDGKAVVRALCWLGSFAAGVVAIVYYLASALRAAHGR